MNKQNSSSFAGYSNEEEEDDGEYDLALSQQEKEKIEKLES